VECEQLKADNVNLTEKLNQTLNLSQSTTSEIQKQFADEKDKVSFVVLF
jgi:hypothetical protein